MVLDFDIFYFLGVSSTNKQSSRVDKLSLILKLLS